MLTLKKKDPVLELIEEAIESCAANMLTMKPDTDEYSTVMEQMHRLIDTRTKMKSSAKISPDVIATIIANLAGIALILNHERVNVIATKAFSHVSKLKM